MDVSPEGQVLIIVGAILGVAYFGIFPTLEKKTINRLMALDLGLMLLALLTVGGLFSGTGVRFNLLFTEVGWVMFTVVTYALIEIPLFLRFAKKHGIPLDAGDDQDRE
ncbi:MAG: hypothetical protein AAFU41_17985 [Pseudomonadota bacterium]